MLGRPFPPTSRSGEADGICFISQRSDYIAPILRFDDNHTRPQHTARSAMLLALRELAASTFTLIAETPRKRRSPAHDEAARLLA